MLIAAQKDHIKQVKMADDGTITVSLVGSSPAAVTVEKGERLIVFFEADRGKTSFVDIKVKKGLSITASSLDCVLVERR